jgi:hypothetical protein
MDYRWASLFFHALALTREDFAEAVHRRGDQRVRLGDGFARLVDAALSRPDY